MTMPVASCLITTVAPGRAAPSGSTATPLRELAALPWAAAKAGGRHTTSSHRSANLRRLQCINLPRDLRFGCEERAGSCVDGGARLAPPPTESTIYRRSAGFVDANFGALRSAMGDREIQPVLIRDVQRRPRPGGSRDARNARQCSGLTRVERVDEPFAT